MCQGSHQVLLFDGKPYLETKFARNRTNSSDETDTTTEIDACDESWSDDRSIDEGLIETKEKIESVEELLRNMLLTSRRQSKDKTQSSTLPQYSPAIPATVVQEDDTASLTSVRLNALKSSMETSMLVLHLECHGLYRLLEKAQVDVGRLDPARQIADERKIRWLQDAVHSADCREMVDLSVLSPECRSEDCSPKLDELSLLDRNSDVSDTESASEYDVADVENSSVWRASEAVEPASFAPASLLDPQSKWCPCPPAPGPHTSASPTVANQTTFKNSPPLKEPPSGEPRAADRGIAQLLETYMSFIPRPGP